jgi:hypothetical protein
MYWAVADRHSQSRGRDTRCRRTLPPTTAWIATLGTIASPIGTSAVVSRTHSDNYHQYRLPIPGRQLTLCPRSALPRTIGSSSSRSTSHCSIYRRRIPMCIYHSQSQLAESEVVPTVLMYVYEAILGLTWVPNHFVIRGWINFRDITKNWRRGSGNCLSTLPSLRVSLRQAARMWRCECHINLRWVN